MSRAYGDRKRPKDPKFPQNETIGEIIERRYSRRDMMRGSLGAAAATALLGTTALGGCEADSPAKPGVKVKADAFVPKGFNFKAVPAGADATDHVAEGYTKKVLLRWGDAVTDDAPEFNPRSQTPGAQNRQFGYNNDYIAYFPLDENDEFIEGEQTKNGNERGLLCINHEYSRTTMMFHRLTKCGEFEDAKDWMTAVEMASVGVTVIKVEKDWDDWRPVTDSKMNRRITATTDMTIDGPVVDADDDAGLKRLCTSYDDTGLRLRGTAANCAGGMTPWGTYLTAEENVHYLFSKLKDDETQADDNDETACCCPPAPTKAAAGDGAPAAKTDETAGTAPIEASEQAEPETRKETAEAGASDENGAAAPTEEQAAESKRKAEQEALRKHFARYRIGDKDSSWGKNVARFNPNKEPNEANRWGWIVEIDPFDPTSTPIKHSALGRFNHEGAETVLGDDNHVVVFSGDDRENEYVYRFVSEGKYWPGKVNKKANMTLLSKGTLSVAKFNDDGNGEWIPLEFGKGVLKEASKNGTFNNQADVMIEARLAALIAEGTAMDRPEDVQPNPKTKRVYVNLTKNTKRALHEQKDKEGVVTTTGVNEANPRANNEFGQIIEIIPDNDDFAAREFKWEMLVVCGDRNRPSLETRWSGNTTDNNWFSCPDNAAVDDQGRLWISTDQGEDWTRTMRADGLYALETHDSRRYGTKRGTPHMFYRVPVGAELCGPCFTPNSETLFVAVQHPGTDGMEGYTNLPKPSDFDPDKPVSYNNPATRWPDPEGTNAEEGMPPRPAVVVITKKGGGRIG